ncbi:hypothetical protein [Geodermatophilus sp. SYSU D00766]
MTVSLASRLHERDVHRTAVLAAAVVAVAVLVLLLVVLSGSGDSLTPVDTLAPAAPGWSPAPPETLAS